MSISEENLMRELLETFSAEVNDHLQNLNQALLQLERRPDDAQRLELLREAFRAAHSLKGAARSVGKHDIEALSHALESVLQRARDANIPLDADTCDVLYDALDAVGQLLKKDPVEIDALQARLSALAADESDEAGAAEETDTLVQPSLMPMPPSEPPPAEDVVEPFAEPPAANNTLSADQTVRVAVQKLDDLMAQAGELLVSRISAEQRLVEMQALRWQLEEWPQTWRDIKTLLPRINGAAGDAGLQLVETLTQHNEYMQTLMQTFEQLHRAVSRDTIRLKMVSGELQAEVRRVRMVPFRTLVLSLQRTVRDTAREQGKQVNLHVAGDEVEMDKTVLESLKDPLIHLLNNAVGHGIETMEVRTKAGKAPEGRVDIVVQQRGGEVHLTVRDDGHGFDLEAIRQASAARGGPALPEDATADQIIALAFLPGVTTVRQVTTMSGRGVGLDVVRQHLSQLQGRIRVESEAGVGATMHMMVPASLTMTRGLLVRVGEERYVLPLLAIEKIEKPRGVFAVEGRYMLPVDGKPLPLTSLAGALDRPFDEAKPADEMTAIVVGVADRQMALLVDDVLDELELAVKPLGRPISRVPNIAGAALLGNGAPVLILNPTGLVQSARRSRSAAAPVLEGKPEDAGPRAHILVVDDSITTRTLEKNILEAAGFLVTTATDGLEALKRLESNAIDVIVADVQMPNLDGVGFTRRVRESSAYREMPVILVTSLESREDREKGMMAGADAYIIKRGFDQAELLATIEQFLNDRV